VNDQNAETQRDALKQQEKEGTHNHKKKARNNQRTRYNRKQKRKMTGKR
jgi:hypothetical protein